MVDILPFAFLTADHVYSDLMSRSAFVPCNKFTWLIYTQSNLQGPSFINMLFILLDVFTFSAATFQLSNVVLAI